MSHGMPGWVFYAVFSTPVLLPPVVICRGILITKLRRDLLDCLGFVALVGWFDRSGRIVRMVVNDGSSQHQGLVRSAGSAGGHYGRPSDRPFWANRTCSARS